MMEHLNIRSPYLGAYLEQVVGLHTHPCLSPHLMCKAIRAGQYSIKDTALQKNPKVPLSCFKSTSARIQTPVRGEGPGPASYSPYTSPEPVKRTILPRRHYLGLAAPPLIPPKDPPVPGPGHYDIVSYTRPPKHLMSSAALMTSTRRGTHATRGHRVPGPGSYEPGVPTKRPFLYNRTNMWIPG
ncbi:O(6)-methylguanine-induced apoptosis 2 [Bagarius yarrelli]|uniref:O(6)-methylguanine-induced apoptosis 2 n=1 Tax=Bagarius yarrelli TaxID=175774 RepID=A0A556V1I9_BAGYA|nr:O(6)-methylguanine-induced apoptosis 2 [Bagarius yarrelli]